MSDMRKILLTAITLAFGCRSDPYSNYAEMPVEQIEYGCNQRIAFYRTATAPAVAKHKLRYEEREDTPENNQFIITLASDDALFIINRPFSKVSLAYYPANNKDQRAARRVYGEVRSAVGACEQAE